MAKCSTLELCAHRRPKLTLLHLFTDLFRKEIFPHSSEYLQGYYFNLANILMSEEEFSYETDLQVNAEELTLVFYV